MMKNYSMIAGNHARAGPRVSRRNTLSVRCEASPLDQAKRSTRQMLVFVPPHPLIKHWMAVLRNRITPGPSFRGAVAELGRLLIYEAARDWLPVMEGQVRTLVQGQHGTCFCAGWINSAMTTGTNRLQVETPLGVADVTFVDPGKPIKVVPILRSGLLLLEQANQASPLGWTRSSRGTLTAAAAAVALAGPPVSRDLPRGRRSQ